VTRVDNGSGVTNCLVFLPGAGPGRPLDRKGEGCSWRTGGETLGRRQGDEAGAGEEALCTSANWGWWESCRGEPLSQCLSWACLGSCAGLAAPPSPRVGGDGMGEEGSTS